MNEKFEIIVDLTNGRGIAYCGSYLLLIGLILGWGLTFLNTYLGCEFSYLFARLVMLVGIGGIIYGVFRWRKETKK